MHVSSSFVRGINFFYLGYNLVIEFLYFLSSLLGFKASPILNGKRKEVYRSERIDFVISLKRKVR